MTKRALNHSRFLTNCTRFDEHWSQFTRIFCAAPDVSSFYWSDSRNSQSKKRYVCPFCIIFRWTPLLKPSKTRPKHVRFHPKHAWNFLKKSSFLELFFCFGDTRPFCTLNFSMISTLFMLFPWYQREFEPDSPEARRDWLFLITSITWIFPHICSMSFIFSPVSECFCSSFKIRWKSTRFFKFWAIFYVEL